jgi:methionyl-tRNA synthetase
LDAKNKLTVTAALPYANGPLHIGHIAGAYLPADIYVRYMRKQGRDVVFICGSDEHGAAITLRAKKDGINPQDIIDKYHAINKQAFDDMHISFDIFHRTSSDLHHETAQEFFKTLNAKDSFDEQVSEQYFDEENNQFLADRYIVGTCPKCDFDGAYGDQCEKCGSTLSPQELINPRSTLSGNAPILKQTSHWYLPMNKHEDWLRDYIEKGELDGKQQHDVKTWRNQVIGQCKSWIDGGLMPRAMTRDLDWGVKVPLPNADGKVLYVWLDAPIGYISATKQWAADNGKDWEPYWKDESTELIHFIGKDNIVFHAIIFPILLKEHGGYILPKNVPANEFLNLEGNKISTSRNWAVWVNEYIQDLPNKEDVLRYVLCSIAPESKDSEFTWKDFQARNNNELVAILGNFLNRALVLTNKYYEGKVPAKHELSDLDNSTLAELAAIPAKINTAIEAHKYREALAEAMNFARIGNKYLAETEPWKLVKTDAKRVETIMNIALQICASLAIVFEPFMPNTAKQINTMLALETLDWNQAGTYNLIKDGHVINKPSLLFEKIEDDLVEAQMTKLEASKSAVQTIEKQKDYATFDNFAALDIRVGEIIEAQPVKKANKLLQLTVDTGLDKRTVVSGIAEHFKAEEIIGQKVSLIINLEPRKLRGVMSEGMILMAEQADGKLSFVSPPAELPNGSIIR